MTPVKLVPSMGWTRRSVAVSMLLALEEHRKEIALRLTALREARALTQDELAHKAGVSEKTVSRLENARHEPELDTLRKLAKALGVALRDLQGEQPVPLGLGETQLDRIEQRINQIYLILTDGGEPVEPGLVADAVAPLVETVESHSQTTPVPRRSRQAGKRRKTASG